MRQVTARKRTAILIVAAVVLGACEDRGTHVFEMPACDGTARVLVLKVPDGYRYEKEDRRVREDLPRDDAARYEFFREPLNATYPDFLPRETADKASEALTFAKLGDPRIPTAWIVRSDANEFYRSRDKGPPEQTADGKYWVYPDKVARSGRPSMDGMNHFVPKGEEKRTLILCQDEGKNEFPTTGRCSVQRLLSRREASCITVGFRIPAEDLSQWQELADRLESRVWAMASLRDSPK